MPTQARWIWNVLAILTGNAPDLPSQAAIEERIRRGLQRRPTRAGAWGLWLARFCVLFEGDQLRGLGQITLFPREDDATPLADTAEPFPVMDFEEIMRRRERSTSDR